MVYYKNNHKGKAEKYDAIESDDDTMN